MTIKEKPVQLFTPRKLTLDIVKSALFDPKERAMFFLHSDEIANIMGQLHNGAEKYKWAKAMAGAEFAHSEINSFSHTRGECYDPREGNAYVKYREGLDDALQIALDNGLGKADKRFITQPGHALAELFKDDYEAAKKVYERMGAFHLFYFLGEQAAAKVRQGRHEDASALYDEAESLLKKLKSKQQLQLILARKVHKGKMDEEQKKRNDDLILAFRDHDDRSK